MSDLLSRVAGAPITWGVDGSPGWGHLLPHDRVLSEMASIGLQATELGPDGFLPADPTELARLLDSYGLTLAGGFVPAVLYRRDLAADQLDYVERAAHTLAACGAEVLVLGPDSHHAGYDVSVEMTGEEWRLFEENLQRVMTIAARRGLVTALHQHWGMAVEQPHHVERLLDETEVELCIDTGHLFLAGADPVAITQRAGRRVAHVHLKDVDGAMAQRVRAGEIGFRAAVIEGMFKPLGEGDVDVSGVIRHLEKEGYQGWYVLEQDVALGEEPAPGEGPVAAAARSVAYLERLTM